MPEQIANIAPRFYINSYKIRSKGARALHESFAQGHHQTSIITDPLGSMPISRLRNTDVIPTKKSVLINWGKNLQSMQDRGNVRGRGLFWLNQEPLEAYKNKLKFFQTYYGQGNVLLPQYSTYATEVRDWISAVNPSRDPTINDLVAYGRRSLCAHSGQGIIPIYANTRPGDILYCKLYTRYVKKAREFRVHFFKRLDTSYWFVQEKKKRLVMRGDQNNTPIPGVRNWDSGWVYTHTGVTWDTLPSDVRRNVLALVPLVTLDFGAIDIIYNAASSTSYVLEINTAPGLEGSTTAMYIRAFKELSATHDWSLDSGPYTKLQGV